MKDSILKFKYKFLEGLSPSKSPPQISPMVLTVHRTKVVNAFDKRTSIYILNVRKIKVVWFIKITIINLI